ncbi:MAG: putative glycoside hydrolase [bacterium]|nr:putative glycoside hydrolase [bacterium]
MFINKITLNTFTILFTFMMLSSLFASNPSLSTHDEIFSKYSSKKPKHVRGIHVSGYAAGSQKFRKRLEPILRETEINTMVICVKEADGEVYIDGIKKAKDIGAYKNVFKDPEEYIEYLHSINIYVIARITLFKDPILANAEYYWSVKDPSGNVWQDYKGLSWVDPFNKRNVWPYLFEIADRCVELGFDELQFDYIRFPTDGKISNCRYLVDYSPKTAVAIINEFLKTAKARYKDGMGIPISVDTFGLTTSANNDLGLGQVIEKMEPYVDAISPMVYPSHYQKGIYGIEYPDKDPYKTVYTAMKYGKQKLGVKSYKFRPYLQDFSLKNHYGSAEVQAQIKACYDNGIYEWILWNAGVKYTVEALEKK